MDDNQRDVTRADLEHEFPDDPEFVEAMLEALDDEEDPEDDGCSEEEEQLPYDEGWGDEDPTDPKNTPIKEWVEPVKVNKRQVVTKNGLQRGVVLKMGFADSCYTYPVVVTDPPSPSWWNGIEDFTVLFLDSETDTCMVHLKTRPVFDQGVLGFKTEKGKNPNTVMFGKTAVFFRTGQKRFSEEKMQELEHEAEEEERETALFDLP